MVKEIEENIEDLQREKEEYFKADGQSSSPSKVSRLTGAPNMYALEGETKARMDEIDSKLRDRNPAAQEDITSVPFSMSGVKLPNEVGKKKDSEMSDMNMT